MKFMIYITLFLLFFAFFAIILLRSFNKKREKIAEIAVRELLKKTTHSFEEEYFFSSEIRKIILKLMISTQKEAKDALFYLCHGKKYEKIRDYLLKNKNNYSASVLSALSNLNLAEEMFSSLKQSDKALVQIAYINILGNKKEEAKDFLNLINEKKLPLAETALYRYCMAKLALEVGDLYNASNDASIAVRLFHKTKSFYEEAKAYFLLGEIYRVSGVSDMAYFMYDEAKKISNKLHCESLKADILGCVGMLFTMQERFNAAQDAFQESLDINLKVGRDKACACIYNQLALLKLLAEDYEESSLYVNKALRYAFVDTNAFSFEVMAKIYFARKDYEEAIKNAVIAQKKYWGGGNLTAYFESLYLEALCLFNQEKYNIAEEKIRHLISISNENETAFHLANAYSLLGAIYMKKEKPQRAKPFFEEAIRHELKNNRIEGMVSDYVNLGIIARDMGDYDGALMNFNEAKRYATEVQNEELIAAVEKYINDIKS